MALPKPEPGEAGPVWIRKKETADMEFSRLLRMRVMLIPVAVISMTGIRFISFTLLFRPNGL